MVIIFTQHDGKDARNSRSKSRGRRHWRHCLVGATALITIASPATAERRIRCSGVDDTAQLQEAIAEPRGGTLILPAGSRCVVHAGLVAAGPVALRGEPGASISVHPEAKLTEALISCGDGPLSIADISLELGSNRVPAVRCRETSSSNVELILQGVQIAQGTRERTTVADSSALVDISCKPDRCMTMRRTRIQCDQRSSTTAIAAESASASPAVVSVETLDVAGCREGLRLQNTQLKIRDSNIQVQGTGALGIMTTGPAVVEGVRLLVDGLADAEVSGLSVGNDSRISSNSISLAGAGGTAIKTGHRAYVTGNGLQLRTRSRGTAINVGGRSRVVGNNIDGKRSSGAVGINIRGDRNVVSSNVSSLAANSTHILVSSVQNVVDGNNLSGGAWGVRPPVFEGSSVPAFTNGARLVGNNMTFLTEGCAVLATGWHAQANQCSWLGPGSAGFWLGSPGPFGSCTSHSLLSGNTIHSAFEDAALIRVSPIGRRCIGPSDRGSSLRDCSLNSKCPAGEKCRRVTCGGIGITGNHLMGASTKPIDVFASVDVPFSPPRVRGVHVADNTLQLAGARALVAFRAGLPPKLVRGVEIDNSLKGMDASDGWQPQFGDPIPTPTPLGD